LIDRILAIEADGADHPGVEIDRQLAVAARELGYTDADLSTSVAKNGRTAFANEGDWAKATMTEEGWHVIVGTLAYVERGVRRECNIYRITPNGEARRRRG